MKVNRWVMPVLGLVILLGTIGAAQAGGLWASSGRQVASGAGGGGEGGGGTGDGSSQVVKGWMTLQEAADAVGLPVGTVAGLTGATDPLALDPATPLSDMEDIVPGFTVSAFRTVLADASAGRSP
jgi:hypothetical protein